jgi:hypothetical protein
MTGIGHGDVFSEPVEVPDDKEQFVSDELIGAFVVFGVQMNPTTIYDSPYGPVEVAWESDRGTEVATLPIIERDEVYGAYFMVGVPKDKRYDPATFEFSSIEYNDFEMQASIDAQVSTLKSCNNSREVGATCAPLAPMAAYRVACRNPFKPTAYYG